MRAEVLRVTQREERAGCHLRCRHRLHEADAARHDVIVGCNSVARQGAPNQRREECGGPMTTSTFTWMQFDTDQAQQARELVRALSEPSTLDSIGIGSIRDGFADILFPGTSTLHTRAIYALAIPWAMQHVARRRPKNNKQYDQWLKDAELKTIGALIDGNPANETGIIGRTAQGGLRRMPSEAYWNALGVWGIRHSPNLGARLTRAEVRSRIIDAPAPTSMSMWDGLPDAPADFPNGPLSILPPAEAARFLLDKFSQVQAPAPDSSPEPSLLAQVAVNPFKAEERSLWSIDP
ncbi:MAG: DUF6361 family protein, partial [Gordonia sp. (in: high G+C Gram-positive bacteria)]|uniref:DUF6361 family protein n=1 Tax=Gordonia sp. (in: high G+C Gram-positive bacteria) TaxID=84139 RepID=UPI003BB51EDF